MPIPTMFFFSLLDAEWRLPQALCVRIQMSVSITILNVGRTRYCGTFGDGQLRKGCSDGDLSPTLFRLDGLSEQLDPSRQKPELVGFQI